MSYHCPTCQRLLYNRRLTTCGFCGALIPASLRFTAEEIAALDKKMVELDEQRAQRESLDRKAWVHGALALQNRLVLDISVVGAANVRGKSGQNMAAISRVPSQKPRRPSRFIHWR